MTSEVARVQARNLLNRAAVSVHGAESSDKPRPSAALMARAVRTAMAAGLRCDVCDVPVQSLRTVVGHVLVRCSRHALKPSGRSGLVHRAGLVDRWKREGLVAQWKGHGGEVR